MLIKKKGSGFSPAHITGFFYLPSELENSLSKTRKADLSEMSFKDILKLAKCYNKIGSVGAGFSIDKGMKSEVEISFGKLERLKNANYPSVECFYNNVRVDLSRFVITRFVFNSLFKYWKEKREERMGIGDVKIKIQTPLPLHAGFGLSGAAALSTAFAVNSALELKLEPQKLFSLAHFADIYFKGGLGDVPAEIVGGFEFRKKPGLPYLKDEENVVKLPFSQKEGKDKVVFLISERELKTATILKDREQMKKIEKAGKEAAEKFEDEPFLSSFFELSYNFTKKAGIVPEELKELLKRVNKEKDCQATLALLGNTVVARGNMKKILSFFKGKGKVLEAKITIRGAGEES